VSQPVDLLRALIRNACVNDGTVESGQEHRSVATLQDFIGGEGMIFEPAPGRQSVVYRVPGSDPDAPSLALVPHLDVVPADPAGWNADPFAAEVIDGWVYGRGAVDMLNVTAAMATAVRPYIAGELQPAGDLIFAAVADEESGSRYGAEPLVEQHWDLVGADYLLTEVAYPTFDGAPGSAVPVSVGEKGAFWSILRTEGTPGHGSAPFRADNALEKLVFALAGVFSSESPVTITGEWSDFVDALDLPADLAAALKDPDRVDAAIDQLAASDPLFARYAHAATRLTVSPNRALGGTKTNTIADRARSEVDIRALPGTKRTDIDVYLRKAMGSAADDVEIEPVMDMEATLSRSGTHLWEVIADSIEELEGHRNLIPATMTVATDARFWRSRGTVAYGVGLFDSETTFSEMLALFHGHNERVSVGSVEKTADLYREILDRFGRT
jgi:acetylornithine deacetylase/succinyl-diaminopimelate desuccinylase-like protein